MPVIPPFIPAATGTIVAGIITAVTDTTLTEDRAGAIGAADITAEVITVADIIRTTPLSLSGFRFRFPSSFPALINLLFEPRNAL